MTEAQVVSGQICDLSACPAPAARVLFFAGEDFFFCNHHAEELEAAMAERPVKVREDDARLVGASPPA